MQSTANLGLFIATSSPRTLLGGSDPGLSKATFPEKKRHKVGTTNFVYFFKIVIITWYQSQARCIS